MSGSVTATVGQSADAQSAEGYAPPDGESPLAWLRHPGRRPRRRRGVRQVVCDDERVPVSRAGRIAAVLILVAVALVGGHHSPATSEAAGGWGVVAEGKDSDLHGTLVDPPLPRPEVRLRDTAGRWFSLATRPEDEVTALFFGYTHCPDVCPTTLADLAAGRRLMPPAVRDKVTVAFVTEDPQRDTPASLRRFLDRFDPSFIGLAGGGERTKQLMAQLHLPATEIDEEPSTAIVHPDSGEGHHTHGKYAVDHPEIVYVFGPRGSVVIYTGGTTPTQYAEDFSRLAGGT